MRVPTRRGDARLNQKPDPVLTAAKFSELQAKLLRMKNSRPKLAAEVKLLAEGGDFSENAGYQLAKGKLRGLNQRIIDLEDHLKTAVIIQTDPSQTSVQIGSRVGLERAGRRLNYTILGSTESDPAKELISYLSPLGAALMGKREGDLVVLENQGKKTEYRLIKVEIA